MKNRHKELTESSRIDFEGLEKSLQLIHSAINQYYEQDPKYIHLKSSEIEIVISMVQEISNWLNEKRKVFKKMKTETEQLALISQIKVQNEV